MAFMNIRPWTPILLIALCLAVCYGMLMIPVTGDPEVSPGKRSPFVWDQDEYWSNLELTFDEYRKTNCNSLSQLISMEMSSIDTMLSYIESNSLEPSAPIFSELERDLFELAVLVGACPDHIEDYVSLFGRIRIAVKNQSAHWDMNSAPSRDRVYRLVYGGRTAVEEVLLQSSGDSTPSVAIEFEEPSSTPSAVLHGVTVHSGDILVSRGGAPTSALIARGSDYPGNFSHVALLHVDRNTSVMSVVESHIETGLGVSTIDEYIRDKKLRIMVLRLRSDLPSVVEDPVLPHRVAEYARNRAMSEHVPYDFAMNFEDHSKLFCSEVAYEAYEKFGIRLWMGLSHISSRGVKLWLAAFGVENFETHEPSDLEYDPQLRVVAEWRDREALFKDHVDNAVVDVMLEAAESGQQLEYTFYMLPVARIAKAYSYLLNRFGGVGPVPEGMSATAALKNSWFSAKHGETCKQVMLQASEFEHRHGYSPPYWELVRIARRVYRSLMQR